MTREISSGSSASPAKRNVANALILLSDFVVDVPEAIARLIRDRAVIIYDNALARTKFPLSFDFINRLVELLACDAELVANVLRRIFPPVPNDASHAGAYSSRSDQSLNTIDAFLNSSNGIHSVSWASKDRP